MKDRHIADNVLTWALFLWMSIALVMTFFYAPIESEMGIVQKIFYFHVPLVYFAIRWWRTQHPSPVIMGGKDSGLDPKMATTLWVSTGAYLLLFTILYRRRLTLENLRNQLEDIRAEREQAQGVR